MAFTYFALNIGFLLWALFLFFDTYKHPSKPWFIALTILVLLTLVFDNLAIWADFFHYSSPLISNLRIGLAPVEDFFYPLVALVIVPALWKRFDPAKRKGTTHA